MHLFVLHFLWDFAKRKEAGQLCFCRHIYATTPRKSLLFQCYYLLWVLWGAKREEGGDESESVIGLLDSTMLISREGEGRCFECDEGEIPSINKQQLIALFIIRVHCQRLL